jgi:predicted amidohydrolase YtcJ
VAAVKLFIDGTIDGGTAWLHDADCHGQSTAPYWKDPRDYTEAVRVLAQAGVQTATHAIGDAAVEHVLDTLAAVLPAGSAVRHRIEHIETLPPGQVPRFAELGVIASMQPSHAARYTRADHRDTGHTASANSGPTGPGAAATSSTPAPSSPWARTGRSRPSTPAASSPKRNSAAPPTAPTSAPSAPARR